MSGGIIATPRTLPRCAPMMLLSSSPSRFASSWKDSIGNTVRAFLLLSHPLLLLSSTHGVGVPSRRFRSGRSGWRQRIPMRGQPFTH